MLRSMFCALVVMSAVAANAEDETFWTVDLVRTMPGKQAEYLESIRRNWARARDLALEDGAILSYRAIVIEHEPLLSG